MTALAAARVGRLARLAGVLTLVAAVIVPGLPGAASDALAAGARDRAPSAEAFRAPRDTWERLTRALSRHDRAAALRELTPTAQARHAGEIDESLAAKPFDPARFGKVTSVTLSGDRFATITLTRKKDDGLYAYDVMLMRGDDGRWRVDRM
ncbi:MAG: hypothetical protein ABIS17_13650 [Casimicrobiaceae bacterium]